MRASTGDDRGAARAPKGLDAIVASCVSNGEPLDVLHATDDLRRRIGVAGAVSKLIQMERNRESLSTGKRADFTCRAGHLGEVLVNLGLREHVTGMPTGRSSLKFTPMDRRYHIEGHVGAAPDYA